MYREDHRAKKRFYARAREAQCRADGTCFDCGASTAGSASTRFCEHHRAHRARIKRLAKFRKKQSAGLHPVIVGPVICVAEKVLAHTCSAIIADPEAVKFI